MVSVFDAPPKLRACPSSHGFCLLHALPSLYPFERPALKPLGQGFVLPAGVLRRRPCGRVTGGYGGGLVGEGVYYVALLLWLSLVVALLSYLLVWALLGGAPLLWRRLVLHVLEDARFLKQLKDGGRGPNPSGGRLFRAVNTSSTAFGMAPT